MASPLNITKDDASYLNQPYYGPNIPPQDHHPNKHGHGHGHDHSSSSSSSTRCTPYSLLCRLFKALTIVLIIIGSIVLVLWLVYQPSRLHVFVESANLTRFDVVSGALAFNLTAVLSVRNPNSKSEIYYKHVQATAFYGSAKLGDMVLPLFHQPKKNTTTFDLSYDGSRLPIDGTVNSTYSKERGEGWFNLSLKFYTKVRLRMIVIDTIEYAPEGDCALRLPVPMNATSMAAGFERTSCHVDEFS